MLHIIFQQRELSRGAFFECESVKSFILPDSIITIEQMAFEGCKSLKSIYIPKNVKDIGCMPFYECDNLMEINLSPENEYFKNSALYTKDDK